MIEPSDCIERTGLERPASPSREIEEIAQLMAEARQKAGISDLRFEPERMRQLSLPAFGPLPADVRTKFVTVEGIEGRWVWFDDSRTEHRIVLVPGGSFVTGGWNTHNALAACLADKARCAVFLLEYRKLPDHPFPNALQELCKALKFVDKHGPSDDAHAESLVAVGDSAGGGLVLSAATFLSGPARRMPHGLVLYTPWVDLSPETSKFVSATSARMQLVETYVGDSRADDPFISPINGAFDHIGPILLQTSKVDILNSESKELRNRLVRANRSVEYQEWSYAPHSWQRFVPKLPEALDAVQETANWITTVRRTLF